MEKVDTKQLGSIAKLEPLDDNHSSPPIRQHLRDCGQTNSETSCWPYRPWDLELQ